MDDTQEMPVEVPEAEVVAVTHSVPEQLGSDWRWKLVLGLAVAAVIGGLGAEVGSGFGFWHWMTGVLGYELSIIPAILAVISGYALGRKGGSTEPLRSRALRWLGMLIGVLWIGSLSHAAYLYYTSPAIHDISTDLADPPQFKALPLRADNLDQVPGADLKAMSGLNPQQRWVLIHQQSYGDIRSVRINESAASVMAKAARLAEARGWEIVLNVPAEGRLEATAATKLMRFKDDIVLRVRPTETGDGSIVDMRSVARVGVSDLGYNAKLVRSFLADLSGTVTAG